MPSGRQETWGRASSRPICSEVGGIGRGRRNCNSQRISIGACPGARTLSKAVIEKFCAAIDSVRTKPKHSDKRVRHRYRCRRYDGIGRHRDVRGNSPRGVPRFPISHVSPFLAVMVPSRRRPAESRQVAGGISGGKLEGSPRIFAL